MVKSLFHKITAFMAAVAVLAHDKLFGLMARQGLVMGANTLTGLIPSLYLGLDQVAREYSGFIPAIARDPQVSRAARGQTITSFITPQATAADVTPGVTAPNDGDQVLSSIPLTISKARYVPIRWNGEEQLGLNNGGVGHRPILLDQITQAFRTLTNEMETDLALAAYAAASRAAGTAGTTPFGTPNDLSDFALTAQILDDNGVPPGRRMVVNSAAMANLRGKQSVLFKVNESGTDDLLRRGRVGQVTDFDIGFSGLITPHIKGTGASYVTSGTYAVGATAITLATGTGTVKAGDVVTFAGDTNKYVVGSGVAAPGVITLNRPGLRMPLASGVAMTIGNSFTPNVAFSRNGLLLATRLPALPVDLNGNAADMADDRTTVQDPFTGVTFEISLYRQYRQIKIEIAAVWGVAAPNPYQIALLLG
jgi:hypothetical protein